MPRLNNENRAPALGMLECGISQNDVARRFGVSRSTIARQVQRVNTTASLPDRPRSGAPRVTSVRQDVFIYIHDTDILHRVMFLFRHFKRLNGGYNE